MDDGHFGHVTFFWPWCKNLKMSIYNTYATTAPTSYTIDIAKTFTKKNRRHDKNKAIDLIHHLASK
jgi:hypothetical protein